MNETKARDRVETTEERLAKLEERVRTLFLLEHYKHTQVDEGEELRRCRELGAMSEEIISSVLEETGLKAGG